MMFPTTRGIKIMATTYTAEEIKVLAERALNKKHLGTSEAIERVAGKYSEETAELHSAIYDAMEDMICNVDPLSAAERI